MKMYRANFWHNEVDEREVIKVTEKTLTYRVPEGEFHAGRDQRENYESSRHQWFESWTEARDRLLNRAIADGDRHEAEMLAARNKAVELSLRVAP